MSGSRFDAPSRRARAACACLMGQLLGVSVLAAQSQPVSPTPAATSASPVAVRDTATQVTRVVRTFLHNDLFALRDSGPATDYDYTSGVGVELRLASAPAVLRRLGRDRPGCLSAEDRRSGCVSATFGISQQIFTPASNTTVPVPGQRPHAGALSIRGGAEWVSARRRRLVQLEIGTTGRPALAAPVQGVFHAITGTQTELGWDNQLVSRLLIGLRYEELRQVDVTPGRAHLRTRFTWGSEAGTRRLAAQAGAEVQLAMNRRRFWMPGDGGAPLPLGPYVLGGAQQEYVAYDMFVDGYGRGRPSTAVRVPRVWQALVGVGWRFAGGHSEFRHVRRGAEYEAQVAPHAYGALIFTFYH